MPIMNYTTKVDVFATLGEIQGQLVKHGAKKIMQDYDNDGHITVLSVSYTHLTLPTTSRV